MKYEALVITGTSGSGKSTIVRELCRVDDRFQHARAVTTRKKRADDIIGEYDYVSEKQFGKYALDRDFVVSAEYRGNHYGILKAEFNRLNRSGKIPVATITPRSVGDLLGGSEARTRSRPAELDRYLTLFLDVPDEIIDKRLEVRESNEDVKTIKKQRFLDRVDSDRCLYHIVNLEVARIVDLIVTLWDYSERAGVLSARLIDLMIDCGMLVEDAVKENIRGASYDLSLGDDYYNGGQIRRLTDSHPVLLIEPYDYAIVTSHEIARFPKDVSGRFDLAVSFFCQGVILSNGPQIDPGFHGPLFCLLVNSSDRPVMLKRRQHYATLEFHKLIEPTHSYKGKYQGKQLLHYLPGSVAQGGINQLKRELDEVRNENRLLRDTTWAILSIVIAIIAIWATVWMK